MKVSWTKATENEESPQVCLSFLGVAIRSLQGFFLGLVLYSILFPYFYCFFFFGRKDDVLFKNAVERNFQSLNLSSAVQYYS